MTALGTEKGREGKRSQLTSVDEALVVLLIGLVGVCRLRNRSQLPTRSSKDRPGTTDLVELDGRDAGAVTGRVVRERGALEWADGRREQFLIRVTARQLPPLPSRVSRRTGTNLDLCVRDVLWQVGDDDLGANDGRPGRLLVLLRLLLTRLPSLTARLLVSPSVATCTSSSARTVRASASSAAVLLRVDDLVKGTVEVCRLRTLVRRE